MLPFPGLKERPRGPVLPPHSPCGPGRMGSGLLGSAPRLACSHLGSGGACLHQRPLRCPWRLEPWWVLLICSFSGSRCLQHHPDSWLDTQGSAEKLPADLPAATSLLSPATSSDEPHLCSRCSSKFSPLGLCLCLSPCLEYSPSLLSPFLSPRPFLGSFSRPKHS